MALINVEIREPSLIRIDGFLGGNRRSGEETEESDSRREAAAESRGPIGAVVSVVATLASLVGLLLSRRSGDDDGDDVDADDRGDGDLDTEYGATDESNGVLGDGGYAVEQFDEGFEIAVEEESTGGGMSMRKVAVGLALVALLAVGAYVLTGSEEENDLEPQF